MNRAPIVIFLLLFGSLLLPAQNRSYGFPGSAAVPAQDQSSQPGAVVSSLNLPPHVTFAGGCPVSMNAKQGVWDHMMQIRNGQKKTGFGQRISLTLADIPNERILAAKVKVLGLSGHNRMLNTGAISGSQPDASRIIKLTSFSEVKDGVTADLYVPGFTSVTSIQLLEIIYANGSTWSNSNSRVCRVAPDPLMLVAEH